MKTKKGYSMIVLVIAIAVILILVSSAVSVLQVSREKTAITNLIYDLTTVEEEIQDFYTSTGTLPIKSFVKENMYELNSSGCQGILSQLSVYDNENYYNVDLSQLGTISVKDSEREYIVNEGSLKVYVKKGVEYSALGKNKGKYYTLTSDLVNGLEEYVQQDEDVIIIGNPITWVPEADLRVVLPKHSLEASGDQSWEDWSFKWEFGPKTKEELEAIPDDDKDRNFEYGDFLKVKSNGIYSIYVKNPENEVTLINVNVTKLDDIEPICNYKNTKNGIEIHAIDNETGIKHLKYKTLKEYNENVLAAAGNPEEDLKGRTDVDYYLMSGVGKDLIYDLPTEIELYKAQKNAIQKAIGEENANFQRWNEDTANKSLLTIDEITKEITKHNDLLLDLNNQLETLKEKYPYLDKISGPKNEKEEKEDTGEWRLVIYLEDYAGNATVFGEEGFVVETASGDRLKYLSTEILARSYNISTEGL